MGDLANETKTRSMPDKMDLGNETKTHSTSLGCDAETMFPSPMDMLRAIDDDEHGWQTTAAYLFDKYDEDSSGSLEKAEFKMLLEDLASHIIIDYNCKYGGHGQVWRYDIKNTIKWDLDTDFSGELSKEEFMNNIKKKVYEN